jgi:hypothetical protein
MPGLSTLATRPFDNDICIEVAALKGSSGDVQFADRIIAERAFALAAWQ